ncbi:MAG: hypothetical protein KTV77_00575 [Wolbachia endosymbiont of Fragariocoptes setiger]|nr:hypothetical protein [Wolbachia endosymbiont of Fragariocoptes setiger]
MYAIIPKTAALTKIPIGPIRESIGNDNFIPSIRLNVDDNKKWHEICVITTEPIIPNWIIIFLVLPNFMIVFLNNYLARSYHAGMSVSIFLIKN